MPQAKFDDSARQNLTDSIREIEKTTDAELVLIVRARSGSYRQADFLFGALLAFAGLLIAIYSPVSFPEYVVVIDVVVFFLIGTLIASRSNFLRRLLTRPKFRAQAVRTHAAAMFYEAGIANTTAEMGILIYLSVLERRLELIADRGVLKAAPPLEWNNVVSELHAAGTEAHPDNLLNALRSLGALLQKHVPATGENPNELPDAPRFELK